MGTWHAQVTGLTLRFYEGEDGFDARVPFQAVARVELIGSARAFVHAALRTDGLQITISQWRKLAVLLREQFGVELIEAERGEHREIVTWSTERAAARPA